MSKILNKITSKQSQAPKISKNQKQMAEIMKLHAEIKRKHMQSQLQPEVVQDWYNNVNSTRLNSNEMSLDESYEQKPDSYGLYRDDQTRNLPVRHMAESNVYNSQDHMDQSQYVIFSSLVSNFILIGVISSILASQ